MGEEKVLCDVANGVFDCSAIKKFQFCPRAFYWRYVRGYETQGFSVAAEAGKLFHLGVAEWTRSGSLDVGLEAMRAAAEVEWPTVVEDFRTPVFMQEALRQYVEQWRESEMEPIVESVERYFCLDVGRFKFAGRMDRCVRFRERVWVMDHKTTTRLGQKKESGFLTNFRPDFSMDGYCVAAKRLFGDCAGVVMDGVGLYKTKPQVVFRRAMEPRTQFEKESWVRAFEQWASRIEGLMEFAKEDGMMWPMSYSCHLAWDCAFIPLCRFGDTPDIVGTQYEKVGPRRVSEVGDE